MQVAKRTPRLFSNTLWMAFFLMSLLVISSAGCDAGAETDCSARTFLVTTTEDVKDGQCTAAHCSLREAIIASNTCRPLLPYQREIYLERGIYSLTLRGPGDERGDLNINRHVSIFGVSEDLTIIQGGESWNDRIFAIGVTGEADFNLLTIQGGNSSGNGGAILNDGRVWLYDVKLESNSANGYGGGLYSNGPALVSGTEVSGNNANLSDGCGGGLFGNDSLSVHESLIQDNNAANGHGICSIGEGDLHIRGSEILRNGHEAGWGISLGGGIHSTGGGTTRIRDSLIQNNRAAIGGGVFVDDTVGSLRLDGVNLEDNRAYSSTGRDGVTSGGSGGGLYVGTDSYIITTSRITGNVADDRGGGVYVATGGDGFDDYIRTAIAHNTASEGGGIYLFSGIIRLRNSTVSSNQAGFGSAIYSHADADGSVVLEHVTISNNGSSSAGAGEALYKEPGRDSWFSIQNTLILGNHGPDCFGVPSGFRSQGYNYAESDACFLDTPTDLVSTPANIGLGSLTELSGTLVHLLPPWSDAVDFVPRSECISPDQPGTTRPTGDLCEIGAYELDLTTMSTDGGADIPLIPTPSAEAEGDPSAIALQNASCRKGADPAHEVHNFLYEGQAALVIGRLSEGTWSYVELPDELGRCWIFNENLELTGPISSLPLFTSPDLPLPGEGGGEEGSGDSEGGDSGGDGQQEDPTDTPNACVEPPNGCPDPQYWSQALCSCASFE